MKKLILAVLLLMLSTPVWAAPDADHDADRAAAAFSIVTPATDDYWILTDTSNSGRFAKVATSNVRAALGLGASDNPTFNSLNITGSNIASSNKQVTKAWTTGLSYTANVTSVIHGGRHYICTSTHTASAAGTGAGTNEPGVGDDWATVWTLGVLGDNTIYTQDTEPAGGTDGDIWVDTNGTTRQRLYTREESTWVAQAGGGGGISHATSDGSYYASRNGAWTAIDSVFVTPTGSGSSLTVTATGFDGNLDTGDNTLQEIAQAFDDFTASGTGDMVLANAQTVTGKKTFENSDLAMLGSSTGATTLASANAGASNYTATFQAATGTVAYTADVPTAGSLSVDDLITLSGVATGTVNLGSFTGATIDDNLTVKAAMQDMETSFEAKLPAGADGEYGAWLTNNTVNPNTYSTGKTGFAYYNSIAYFCINGTCSAIGTNPMTASGDMVKGGTSGVPTRMIPATGVVSFLETSSSANLDTAVTDDVGSGYLMFNTAPTVVTSIAPTSADGATLGTTALEFSDLYLAAGGVIYGENGQENSLTSSATGWTANLDLTITGSDLILGAEGVQLTGDGDGAVTLLGRGDGSDEALTINLDDTSNTVGFSSSTGVTALNFSAINLTTTGYVQGGVKIVTDANGMSESEMTTGGMYGTLFLATGAGTWTLPTAVEGMSGCLRDTGTNHDLILDVQTGDDFQLLGVEDTNGDGVTNAATTTTGDMICFVATSAGHWMSMGIGGVWTAQ